MNQYRAQRVLEADGSLSATLLGPNSVVEPAEDYLCFLQNIGRSWHTTRGYASDLALYFDFLDRRGMDWREVGMPQIGAFTAHLRGTNRAKPNTGLVLLRTAAPSRSPASVQRALTAVFGFYDFHADTPLADALTRSRQHRLDVRRYVSKDPRSIVAVKVPKKIKPCLSKEQLVTVLTTPARLRDRLLLSTMGLNGLRVGAALGLRHEDIRVRKGELAVVPRDDNANNARAKRRSTLTIPLHPTVGRLYTRYLDEEYGDWDSDYVFINLWSTNAGAPMTYDNVRSLIARTSGAAKIPMTAHVLRHAFGTRELNNGAPQEVVQELLDHDNPAMTRGYARLTGERLKQEFLSAARFNAAGERLQLLAPDSALADVAWMKEQMNRAKVTLPNGYCALPLQQTCEVQNACLDCNDYFVTTPEFIPAHEAQRERTVGLIDTFEASGQSRMAEKNRQVLVKLDTLLETLRSAE
ncbi:tyrosine-type recombinase/integrase (plasmid) [Streptomyces sp. NBC_01450]|uniref:tyrosine-type recombinase/integrase n=1 Tax=Streptomyces sp. NBC_01450 TaxID=2903871 RepID=UPI002E362737|nr:tyrosine-type recombinase/integrase [Streptomyces sp. NBC_01450]